MKGTVEVYAIAADGSKKLLVREPNLVVDGAGESVVDMLTVPSSTLGIAPRVMDTSNWRWGAISFAPAQQSFSANAYTFPEEVNGRRVLYDEGDKCLSVSGEDVTSWFDQVCTDKAVRVRWVSGSIGEANGATASSYTPPYALPATPNPLDRKLADAKTSYAIVSGDGTQCFGQHENRIQFAPNDASSYFQGAFPHYPGSDNDNLGSSGLLVSSYDGDFQADASANMIAANYQFSHYNKNQTMDFRGFLTTQYNDGGAFGSAGGPFGRALVNGTNSTIAGFLADMKVIIGMRMPLKDIRFLNLYGGIFQIGLWNMDTPTALLTNEPPFLEGNFTQTDPKFINPTTGVTKQEFKLFAKKTFSDNLLKIQDNGSNSGMLGYQILEISWHIDFRSNYD